MNALPLSTLVLALLAACTSKPEIYILDASVGPQTLHQCTRKRIESQGFWTPDWGSVASAEKRLDEVSRLEASISNPHDTFRQYVGIYVDGAPALYLNAGPYEVVTLGLDIMDVPYDLCDGGSSYWGAVFDLGRQHFVSVMPNDHS